MSWSNIPVTYISFNQRAIRSRYIAETYESLLHGDILDVGCWEADLREAVNNSDAKYTGIDFGGRPDIEANLEKLDRLPFEDSQFDCVVCTDVLEHLENLHFIAGELARVSKKHLIISLPNNWVNARQPIARGRGSVDKYGLPIEAPKDRHKWFFNLSEARAFLEGYAEKYELKLLEMHVTEKPRPALVRFWLKLGKPAQEAYLNRYAHTIWASFEKLG
mgnify:FL=1